MTRSLETFLFEGTGSDDRVGAFEILTMEVPFFEGAENGSGSER